MNTEMMNVTGMQCCGCPIKLSLALRESVGIVDVQIPLASGETPAEIRSSKEKVFSVLGRA